MGLFSWLLPGNDHELADDLSTQRRQSHQRGGATRAARQGQAWEDADRALDRRGDRHTDWDS
jgi:hypothetical protein